MDNIEELSVSDCGHSGVKIFRLKYKQSGISKSWDVLNVPKSVSIVVFNISRKVLLFVRQFSPVMYYSSLPVEARTSLPVDTNKYPGHLGVTLETFTRIADKDLPLAEIAREEIKTRCGYDVPASAFHKIVTYRQGNLQSAFFVEVSDKMKIQPDSEVRNDQALIEVVEMTDEELRAYIEQADVQSSSNFLFLANWFLNNKAANYKSNISHVFP